MRILVPSYAFGPRSTPSGISTWRLVQGLAASGNEVTVIYAKHYPLADPRPEVRLLGCSAWPHRPSSLFVGLSNLLGKDVTHWWWCRRAAAVARSCAADVVYARGSPVSSLVAGGMIHQRSGTPLVLHFADPIPAPPVWLPSRKSRRRLLRTVRPLCGYAAGVTAVTEEMLDFQAEQTGAPLRQKGAVVPHCLPEWERLGRPPEASRPVFLYLGSFYGPRRPDELLEGFGRLVRRGVPSAKLLVAGGRACAAVAPLLEPLGLRQHVELLGQVETPVGAMRSARVLVEVEVEEPRPTYLSAKSVEYLSKDRVVLGIVTAGSPISKIFAQLPRSTVAVGHDPAEIASGLERASLLEWTADLALERRTALESFTERQVTARLEAFLRAHSTKSPGARVGP